MKTKNIQKIRPVNLFFLRKPIAKSAYCEIDYRFLNISAVTINFWISLIDVHKIIQYLPLIATKTKPREIWLIYMSSKYWMINYYIGNCYLKKGVQRGTHEKFEYWKRKKLNIVYVRRTAGKRTANRVKRIMRYIQTSWTILASLYQTRLISKRATGRAFKRHIQVYVWVGVRHWRLWSKFKARICWNVC